MNHLKKSLFPFGKTALLALLAMSALPLLAQDNDIPQRARQAADSIRIVTANIRQTYFLADKKTGDDWDSRKELCRDVLLAQDADIICIQENHIGQVAYLKKSIPHTEFFSSVKMRGKDKSTKDLYNPILYSAKRFEKLDAGGFWLSDTPEVALSKYDDAYMARHVNWLLLRDKKTGKKLRILNTHLEHKFGSARVKQIAVLLAFADKLPPDTPVVITGDFNTGMDSPTVRMVLEHGWLDSYSAIHGPDDPGGTAHRFLGEKFINSPEGKKRRKIDFIFHNKLLKPTSSEIIKDSRGGKYPSDHYFVSAEFDYTK